jgi:hypothetical protein
MACEGRRLGRRSRGDVGPLEPFGHSSVPIRVSVQLLHLLKVVCYFTSYYLHRSKATTVIARVVSYVFGPGKRPYVLADVLIGLSIMRIDVKNMAFM